MSTDKRTPETAIPTDRPANPADHTATDERKGKHIRGFERLDDGDPPDGRDD